MSRGQCQEAEATGRTPGLPAKRGKFRGTIRVATPHGHVTACDGMGQDLLFVGQDMEGAPQGTNFLVRSAAIVWWSRSAMPNVASLKERKESFLRYVCVAVPR